VEWQWNRFDPQRQQLKTVSRPVLTVALMLQCCVRPSVGRLSVLCNVCIVAKWCSITEKFYEESNRKWPRGIEWSRDR